MNVASLRRAADADCAPPPGREQPVAATRVSVIIPVYEEALNIASVVDETAVALTHSDWDWEVVIVDDGSADRTWLEIQALVERLPARVRALRLRRRFGQSAALQAGIDAARGEVIVILDGDGQNPACEIPALVSRLLDEELDMVVGWRHDRQDGRFLRVLPSRAANALIRWMTGVHLHDVGCSLKAVRAEVLGLIHLQGEMHRFIPAWVAAHSDPARIAEQRVAHRRREHGRSKYGLSRTIRVLLDLLAVLFFMRYSTRPGHFFGGLGLLSTAIGSGMLAYLLMVKLSGEDIGQRPMLLSGVLLVMTGVQLITTGVLGELIGRMYHADPKRDARVYSVRTELAGPEQS